MKLRQAERKDRRGLTELWKTCFCDDEKIVEAFWRRMGDRVTVFLAEEKRPIAMACALPAEVTDEAGETRTASYLYAVCTDPAFRGRGICRSLLAFAEKELKKAGTSLLLLVPAQKSLFDFYGTLGFCQSLVYGTYRIPSKDNGAKITKISPESYENIREMQLWGNFVSLGIPAWALLQDWGGLYRIETSDGVYCAAAQKEGNLLQVRELLPDSREAAAALGAYLKCTEVQVCTEGNLPRGVAKSLTKEPCPENLYAGPALE